MMSSVMEVAETIASKSPVAVQGSKINLLFSRDHSVQDGLNYMVCMINLLPLIYQHIF